MLKLKKAQDISQLLLLFYNVILFILLMLWEINSDYDLILTNASVLLLIPSVLLTTASLSFWFVRTIIMKKHGQDIVNLVILIIGTLTFTGIIMIIAFSLYQRIDIKSLLIINCVLSLLTSLLCILISNRWVIKRKKKQKHEG